MHFSRAQRKLALRAMDEAEDRTARYYCIPPYQRQELRYDLLTCQDCEWEPLPDSALAGVQLLQGLRLQSRDPSTFFRIQLNDPIILNAVLREKLDSHFYPFLVYILTHEMVHLVRLSTILEDPAILSTFDEEHRVQSISRQILTGPSEFRPVLEKFCLPPCRIEGLPAYQIV